jgi:hypothetical protein
MLSVVGEGYSDSELGTQILNEEVGNGFLTRLHRRRIRNVSGIAGWVSTFMNQSDSIHAGSPAKIRNYDRRQDAIVFAYDPDKTPEPKMELRAGRRRREKLLFMNGKLVVRFANARSMSMSDINVIETGLSG